VSAAGVNEARAIELADNYDRRGVGAVLILIGRFLDRGESPSIGQLAEAVRMTASDVRTAVRVLEREGDLEVSPLDGTRDAYRILQSWETGW
jgi:DNA-binding MarR family transcriptional regulator